MDTFAQTNRYLRNTGDLGPVSKPLLVCGGACSNLEALTALLEAAAGLGIPNERIIHTGDAVAYCADPVETARLLRAERVHAIQGNVEESLWAAAPDCGCGFDEGSPCDKLSAEWFSFADDRIDSDVRRWMGRLPYQLTFTMAGKRVRIVHGGVAEINRFLFASTSETVFAGEFSAAKADVIVAGHSGLPFTRNDGNRVWHNSGSLGLPANDGTPRVWFSLMIPETDGIRFEHHALSYDHTTARAKMQTGGLPEGYADALVTGLWPNLDILPRQEKNQTGVALDESSLNPAAQDTAAAV